MLYNPQAAAMQSPQAYFPSNAPQVSFVSAKLRTMLNLESDELLISPNNYLQYGQQMIVGHPRPVMYMQGYPGVS